MLKNILKKYKVTHYIENQKTIKKDFLDEFDSFKNCFSLISKYGGYIIENGMFQIYNFEKASKWTNLITKSYFPEFKDTLFCFAVTWQGCILAINDKDDSIYLFDPATCEYFAMEEVSLEDFMTEIFLENEDDIIYSEDFLNTMTHLKKETLDSECSVTHKVSLFLGGEDKFENLEIIDTEVMWDLQIQIAEGINEIQE